MNSTDWEIRPTHNTINNNFNSFFMRQINWTQDMNSKECTQTEPISYTKILCHNCWNIHPETLHDLEYDITKLQPKFKHVIGSLRVWTMHPQLKSAKNAGTWWRHQMKTFSALLAICAGNSPVPGEFPAQRSVTRSFDVCLDLRLNKQLSKQSWGWWFETLSRPLWRHSNE